MIVSSTWAALPAVAHTPCAWLKFSGMANGIFQDDVNTLFQQSQAVIDSLVNYRQTLNQTLDSMLALMTAIEGVIS
jgi:hypothetical protein